MRLKIYLFVIQFFIIYNQRSFVNSKPFFGNNIREARNNEFPFVVSLIYIENEGTNNENIIHMCTGTLISKMDIVTSAHCLFDQFRNAVRLVHGSNDFKQGQRSLLLWWITFERWARLKNIAIEFQVNDIANIRLIQEVPESIVPVKISQVPNLRLYGKQVISAGWSAVNTTQVSTTLKTVKLKVISNEQCVNRVANMIRQRIFLDARQGLCTIAQPFTLLNYGVSGGPLLYRNKLVAINKGTVPLELEDNDPNLINLHVAVEYYKTFMCDIVDSDLV